MTNANMALNADALDDAEAINQRVRCLIRAAQACMNGPGDPIDAMTLLELGFDQTVELDRKLALVNRHPQGKASIDDEGFANSIGGVGRS